MVGEGKTWKTYAAMLFFLLSFLLSFSAFGLALDAGPQISFWAPRPTIPFNTVLQVLTLLWATHLTLLFGFPFGKLLLAASCGASWFLDTWASANSTEAQVFFSWWCLLAVGACMWRFDVPAASKKRDASVSVKDEEEGDESAEPERPARGRSRSRRKKK
jgi:hypothetical protein